MSATKKPPAPRRRTAKPAPTPPSCGTCSGTGEAATAVRVGRKHREIDATQTALCLDCLGTGSA
ncbi:hypothetical protein SUDANB120_04270 [Streptomyces sp. enrichment culture]|uniref:hypothetical protein n=1 Tax=Streptomyces sp. enrichment culture TaxID=1795815 RepID=UPI003F55D2D9